MRDPSGQRPLVNLPISYSNLTRALVSLSVVDKPANNNTLLSNNVNGTQSATASNISVGAAAEVSVENHQIVVGFYSFLLHNIVKFSAM